MRTVNEIISDTQNTDYTGTSGAVLDICRELAIYGRFEEIADVLSAWCMHVPSSEDFIRARLPSIILNSYIVKLNILTFTQFLEWENSFSDWGHVKQNALSRTELPSTMAAVVSSMRQFRNNA